METILYLSVTGSKIKATNAIDIMSNSQNWYKCSFSFDSAWDGLTKTAVFSNDKKSGTGQTLEPDNTCYIPACVLRQAGYLYIGVIHSELLADDSMETLPTQWTFVTIREGVDTGRAISPPDQNVYEAILRNTTQAYAYAADVEVRANEGDFTATVALGTVTTGESGSAAVITNTGTDQDAVLNFTLPRGIQGEQGIQGVQGEIGPQGATGKSLEYLWNGTQLGLRVEGDSAYTYVELKGTTGAQGVEGVQGEAGTSAYLHIRWGTSATPATLLTTPDQYIGVCASASSTAPADYAGYSWYQWKGIQGATGAQGEQGEKGDKGDTGNTGPQGPSGLNWLGAYSAATTYAVDDAVSYNGSSYICILASTGNLPTNATYWELLASKGTDGAGAGDMLALVYDPTGVEGDAFDMDNMVSGTTNKVYTATEQSKLSGIAAGANNYTHPATHSADIIVDGTTNKAYTATEKTKLAGIATGAEVNVNADWNAASGAAQILNKPATFAPAAHTQAASTITDFDTEVGNHTDVAANTTARHTHSNKTALDAVSGTNTGDQTLYLQAAGNGYALNNGSTRPTLGTKAVDLSYASDGSSGAVGNYSFVEGSSNIARGSRSHAEGQYSDADGSGAHAEGEFTICKGAGAHVEGYSSVAYEGTVYRVTAVDNTAKTLTLDNVTGLSVGNTVRIIGSCNAEISITNITDLTITLNTTATLTTVKYIAKYTVYESGLHAEGGGSKAIGAYTHSEGCYTLAMGHSSHSQNHYTIAQGYGQTTIGRFNVAQGTPGSFVNTDQAFIIGNGTADDSRSNALSVDWAGKLTVAGGIDGGGTICGTEYDNGDSGTAKTIDWRKGNHQKVTITGNCTFTFTAPSKPCMLSLRLIQDATGSRAITLPTMKKVGGTAFTWSTAGGAIDILSIYYDGTNYYGQNALAWS